MTARAYSVTLCKGVAMTPDLQDALDKLVRAALDSPEGKALLAEEERRLCNVVVYGTSHPEACIGR